jgi:hypothetical protein
MERDRHARLGVGMEGGREASVSLSKSVLGLFWMQFESRADAEMCKVVKVGEERGWNSPLRL